MTVRLRLILPTAPIQLGTRKAVLVVYPSIPPVYEVEFIDDAGRSLGTFTLEEKNLEEVNLRGRR